MNAFEIVAKLEKKYAAPSWAFFTGVKDSVGFGSRTADGVAVAMWRSLGLEIVGFEIKVSRQDWLRELKNGGKSDAIFRYCNRWWVVVSDSQIVKTGELPPTWGLMCVNGKGFKVIEKAPPLKADPLTVWFVAEILRRHFNSLKEPEEIQRAFARGVEAGKQRAIPSQLDYEIKKAEELRKRVEQFEAASRIKIDDWRNPKEIGDAVRLVIERGPSVIREDMQALRDEAQRLVTSIDQAIAKTSRF